MLHHDDADLPARAAECAATASDSVPLSCHLQLFPLHPPPPAAVPNPDAVKVWARENGKVDGAGAPAKLEALGNDEGLKKAILAELQAQGKARGLQGFEIPKGIHLDPVAWTPDDLLTPSFKLKRADAKKKYAAEIEALYGKLETVAGKAGLKQA